MADIAIDAGIIGVITSIAAWVFGSGEVAATAAITGDVVATGVTLASVAPEILPESGELIYYLLDEEGTQAAVDISTGNSIISTAAELEELAQYDAMSTDIVETIYGEIGPSVENNTTLINKVSLIIKNVASKIPMDSAGFKNLIIDIVKGAINNPKKALAIGAGVATAGVGLAGMTSAIAKQIKRSFDKGEKIPKDIQKLIRDGKLTLSNLHQTATDITESVLPTSLLPKSIF